MSLSDKMAQAGVKKGVAPTTPAAGIKKVSDARSSLGAQSNALSHTISANDYSAYNTTASQSMTEDNDYGEELAEQKKTEVMDQYRMFSLKAQAESESGILKLFQ